MIGSTHFVGASHALELSHELERFDRVDFALDILQAPARA
jgi:hypothetical protein